MATGNTLSIFNRALLAIGSQAQISSIQEDSTQAAACNALFTPTFEQVARAAYWNCLRKQAVLTVVAAAAGTPENPDGTSLIIPPSPFLYAYAYPSDCLAARCVLPYYTTSPGNVISPNLLASNTYLPDFGQIPFKVGYFTDANGNPLTVILTNQPQAQLVYTVNQPNPQLWDSEFQGAVVATLAAQLVPALALNMSLMKMQIAIADKIITDARVRDANEGSNTQDHIPDWIRARNSGNGYYNNGFNANGYTDIVWGF